MFLSIDLLNCRKNNNTLSVTVLPMCIKWLRGKDAVSQQLRACVCLIELTDCVQVDCVVTYICM